MDNAEWETAMAAELPHVPPGRERAGWILGGLWFAATQRGASWPVRWLALFGAAWTVLWLLVTMQSLVDDAPDLAWPYSGWLAGAQSLVALVFLLACWRPLGAALLAIPAMAGYAAALWTAATINSGSPVVAVAIFTGPSIVLFGLTAIIATVMPAIRRV